MRQIQRHALALFASALTSSMAVAQQPPRQGPPPRPAPGAPQAGAPDGRMAQGGGRRQMGQGPERDDARGPRAGGRRSGPGGSPAAMLLRMRTELALTDEQVTRLEALAAAPRPTLNEADMLRARADMLDATKGDGDLAKTRAALDKMSRLRNDAVLAQLKARQDVRAVLTAAQKTTLDNLRGERRRGMRGAARGERGGRARGAARNGPRRGGEPNMEVIIERRRTPPPSIDSLPPQ